MRRAEYVWLDGEAPTRRVRSKAWLPKIREADNFAVAACSDRGCHAPSIGRATGHDPGPALRPVRVGRDAMCGADAREGDRPRTSRTTRETNR